MLSNGYYVRVTFPNGKTLLQAYKSAEQAKIEVERVNDMKLSTKAIYLGQKEPGVGLIRFLRG